MGSKHSTQYSGGHTSAPTGTTGTYGDNRHTHGTTGTTTAPGTDYGDDRHISKGHKAKNGALLASTLFWSFLNLLIFAAICGLVGHLFHSWINGNKSATTAFTNPAGMALLFFSLLAAAVGLATTIMAMIHGAHQTDGAKHGTLGANLVSFAMTAIAFCFACQAIHSGIAKGKGGGIKKELIAVAALDIIALFTLLMYLLQLGLFRTHKREALPTHYTQDNTYAASNTAGTHHHGTHQPKSLETHSHTTTTAPERAYAA
jgi:hypothetical protein